MIIPVNQCSWRFERTNGSSYSKGIYIKAILFSGFLTFLLACFYFLVFDVLLPFQILLAVFSLTAGILAGVLLTRWRSHLAKEELEEWAARKRSPVIRAYMVLSALFIFLLWLSWSLSSLSFLLIAFLSLGGVSMGTFFLLMRLPRSRARYASAPGRSGYLIVSLGFTVMILTFVISVAPWLGFTRTMVFLVSLTAVAALVYYAGRPSYHGTQSAKKEETTD